MFETRRSTTAEASLEHVLDRLRASPLVDGLMLAGSGNPASNPDSDIDLLVLMTDHPAPRRYGCTWIDRRIADLAFLSTTEADDVTVGRSSPSLVGAERDWMLRALQQGQIRFDRSGRLAAARAALQSAPPQVEGSLEDVFRRWDHANYNLAQSRRYAGSANPLYREAFELRMTYQLADVMVDYFIVRGLPWLGEKLALSHWEKEDAPFKALFFACLREGEVEEKLELYRDLLTRALAPVGSLWPEYAVSWGASSKTGQLWQTLLGE